jgi:hypothetical protein
VPKGRPVGEAFRLLEGSQVAGWRSCQVARKLSLLGPGLARFWPGPRNAQNESPGVCSGQALGWGAEILKMSFLEPVLARFWAWGQKC